MRGSARARTGKNYFLFLVAKIERCACAELLKRVELLENISVYCYSYFIVARSSSGNPDTLRAS